MKRRLKTFLRGVELQKILIRKNMTQKEFARQSNIAPEHISSLINGYHSINARTRTKIMEAMPDLGFDDLFEIFEEEPTPRKWEDLK